MKVIDNVLAKLDNWQQNHTWIGFPYAVVKKYGDDQAGYQAALITYYGFLSLFPLIIVATATLELILRNNEHLREQLLEGINNYFPIIGSQLQSSIHTPGNSGVALIVGLLITLYGARGVADAVQHALNHIWQVPKLKRAGFPKALFKSLGLILVGGGGLLGAAFLSSYATALGHGLIFKILASLISLILLMLVLLFVFHLGSSANDIPVKYLLIAALVAALGLQILQTFGGYIITHQLQNLRSLYGTFSVVLGLLFWIYLQAQVLLYAVEIATVAHLRLWPRSLTQKELTPADQYLYRLQAKRERMQPPERIRVKFRSPKKD